MVGFNNMSERKRIDLIVQLIINMDNHNGSGQELIQIDKLEGKNGDGQLQSIVIMYNEMIH